MPPFNLHGPESYWEVSRGFQGLILEAPILEAGIDAGHGGQGQVFERRTKTW